MPKTIVELNELRERMKLADTEMRTLDEKATAEKRSFTEVEQTRYDELKAEIAGNVAELKRAADLEEQGNLFTGEVRGMTVHDNMDDDPKAGFRDLADYMHSLVRQKKTGVTDKRLSMLNQRASLLGDGASGGWSVPTVFSTEIMDRVISESPIRGLANVQPANTGAPDAAHVYNAFDQKDGVYAGVSIQSVKEVTAADESTIKHRSITLSPKKMSALVPTSNDLLRNNSQYAASLTKLLSTARNEWEQTKFLLGSGAAEPLGILSATDAVQVVTRNTASKILFADVTSMLSKVLSGSKIQWTISQNALAQIVGMADAAGNSIYIQGDITKGIPNMLFGIPVFFSTDLPNLGTAGDAVLTNWERYMIKDGSAMVLDFDGGGSNFSKDQTMFRMLFWVDGQPIDNAAIPAKNSSATYKVGPAAKLK